MPRVALCVVYRHGAVAATRRASPNKNGADLAICATMEPAFAQPTVSKLARAGGATAAALVGTEAIVFRICEAIW